MYKAFSLAGLMPVVLVAVTHSSYWALGTRSVTVQWVSFTFTLLTEKGEHRFECGCANQNTSTAASFREIRRFPHISRCNFNSRWCYAMRMSVSLCYTVWYTGAVCWRVLQHRSVVKLIVLHCVVWEQAPAHTQGRLGGRVGYLRVDYWGRRSCRRDISPVLLSSHTIKSSKITVQERF